VRLNNGSRLRSNLKLDYFINQIGISTSPQLFYVSHYFDVEKYKSCPLRNGCYKEGAKTKTYSVSIKSELHQDQIAFQETEYYKEKPKHRYKIEAKNSELKNVHGYDRAISYGIANMQMQGAIAIFCNQFKKNTKNNVGNTI
jgi:hypothetical protein